MNKFKKAVYGLAITGGTFLATGSVAFASTVPADPTDGQLQVVQDGVITFVVDYGAPALFALTLLGILVRLALKWMKRAGRAV